MSVGVWKPDCNIRFSGRSSLPAKHSAFKTTRSCIISAFLSGFPTVSGITNVSPVMPRQACRWTIPIKGTLQSFHVTDSIPHKLDSQPVSAPWQWSVNTSIGIQYRLTPQAGIYLEPTVNYYIPDGSQLRTIRKEHPFTFTLPVGLRISW